MPTASPGQIDVPDTTHWWVGLIDTRHGSPNSRYVKLRHYLSLTTRWRRQELPRPGTGLLRYLLRTHTVRFGHANDFVKAMAQPQPRATTLGSPGPTGAMAPPEAAQEDSQRGRRLDHAPQHPIGSPLRAARQHSRCSRHRPMPTPSGSGTCLPHSPDLAHLPGQPGCPPARPVPDNGAKCQEGSARHWPPGGGHRPWRTGL